MSHLHCGVVTAKCFRFFSSLLLTAYITLILYSITFFQSIIRGMVVARSIAGIIQDNTFNRGRRPLCAHLYIIDSMQQQIFEVNAAGMYSEVKGGCAGKFMDEGRKMLEEAVEEFKEAHSATDLVNKTILCMMGKDKDTIHRVEEESGEGTATDTDGSDKRKHNEMAGRKANQILRGSKDQLKIISIPVHPHMT